MEEEESNKPDLSRDQQFPVSSAIMKAGDETETPLPKDNEAMPSSSGRTLVEKEVSSPSPAKKTPNDFVFGKLLGEGSFSTVYLAKDVKTSKEYAIKVCDKLHIIREKKAESIRREKEVLTILSANRSETTPFFVHLYATFQDTHRLYFVVTLAHGGELLKYLHKGRSFDLTCCRFYSAEILQALRHLHTIGIVHRDLKPENILLTEQGHILVTDFGSAKIVTKPLESSSIQSAPTKSGDSPNDTRKRSNSFVGTAQYVSPEVLKAKHVGPPADLWAFGCIIFQLGAGVLPFQSTHEYLIFQKILKLEYEFPPNFPSSAKDLVEQLLKLEADDRLGAKDEQLYQSIQSHPFFEGIEFDKLCQQVPPVIVGIARSQSQRHKIPDDYEPGFDPRVIATRGLRSDQEAEFSFRESKDDEDSDNDSDLLVTSSFSDGIGKLSVAGDPSPPTEKLSTSSNSVQLPKDDTERKERLEEQLKTSPSSHSAVKGNLILKQGLVNKRKGLFARKRLLFLTEGPHLYYCEPNTLNVKGEIPWSKELKPEARGFKIFFVHTPNRTYYLEDPEGYALDWCKAINEIHQHVYGNSVTTPLSPNQ